MCEAPSWILKLQSLPSTPHKHLYLGSDHCIKGAQWSLEYVCMYMCVCVYKVIVDTVFCPLLICLLDPEKPKSFIFSPWGHENIYNGAAQPIQTPEHSKCLFQPK